MRNTNREDKQDQKKKKLKSKDSAKALLCILTVA